MKITVAGQEAVGLLFTAHLARTKNEVWLLEKDQGLVQKIGNSGIRVEGLSRFSCKVNATTESKKIGSCEAVILCVKAFDTEETIKKIKPLINEDTFVLSLQDGLGNIQILNDYAGEDKVIAGVTKQAATHLSAGVLQHTSKGETVIGRINKQPLGKARSILSILNQAGLSTRSSRDINSLIWSKLIISTGINALSAITRLSNGSLLEYPGAREFMRQAVFEAVRVAKKKRVKINYEDPIQKLESVCKATSTNLSSMLEDVLNKRKTEIDFINGAIVRQGKSLGLATPANEALTNLVRTIETSYKARV